MFMPRSGADARLAALGRCFVGQTGNGGKAARLTLCRLAAEPAGTQTTGLQRPIRCRRGNRPAVTDRFAPIAFPAFSTLRGIARDCGAWAIGR
jgi:hypothetical protein